MGWDDRGGDNTHRAQRRNTNGQPKSGPSVLVVSAGPELTFLGRILGVNSQRADRQRKCRDDEIVAQHFRKAEIVVNYEQFLTYRWVLCHLDCTRFSRLSRSFGGEACALMSRRIPWRCGTAVRFPSLVSAFWPRLSGRCQHNRPCGLRRIISTAQPHEMETALAQPYAMCSR